MKKLMIVALSAVALSAFAELKVATVDMTRLVKNHPSYNVNKTTLTSAEGDYQKRIDQLRSDCESIQAEGKKLSGDLQNPMLAAAAKADLEKKMIEIQERFVAAQQKLRQEAMSSQQKLAEMEGRLLKAQTDDIRAKIGAYAGKNGIDLVLDNGSVSAGALSPVLFAKPSLDVTDAVLKLMGVNPAEAKGDEGK